MNNQLSFEEMRSRLDALLRAGVIDKTTYDRRLEAARNSAAPTARPQVRDQGGGQVRQNTTPRVDQSNIASAPYRFVSIAPGWVKAPRGATGALDEPKSDGYVAEIEVEFTVESPLLIGDGEGGNGDVRPLAVGRTNQGLDWIIPGSTLRGWLRNELEIVAFARLDQYNRNRVFGLRDFDHAAYGSDRYPVADVGKLKAGWLRRIEKARYEKLVADSRDNKAHPLPSPWEILECPAWYVMPAEPIASTYARNSNKDFTQLDLISKYQAVDMLRDTGKGRMLDLPTFMAKNQPATTRAPDEEINGKPSLRLKSPRATAATTEKRGHFVFSGRSPSGKRLEYWFDAPKDWADVEWRPLTEEQWTRFEDINSAIVGDARRPQGSYEALMPTLMSDERLPVPIFFVGDPKNPEVEGTPNRFAFGLTRLFKVPHTYDLRTVVERSGHARAELLDPDGSGARSRIHADFVENLFGYVHEPDEWDKEHGDKSAAPRDFARRGRIAVGAARLVSERAVRQLSPTETVMAAAKPSFAPFYLVGASKDYSDPSAKIAGRKVYLPRFDTAAVASGSTRQEVARLLQRQIDAIRAASAANKSPNEKITTRLAFLDPGDSSFHPRFRSKIRLFNVTAEEIGAVVWVLTHGGSRKHRHMLGRAKAFGAGQVAVAVKRLDAAAIFPEGTIDGDAAPSIVPTGDPTTDASAFRARFESFMEDAVRNHMVGDRQVAWKTSATITDWFAARDPEVGARLAAANKLDTMPLKSRAPTGKDINPYKTLRDMTKPRKDRRPTAGPNRLLDFGKR